MPESLEFNFDNVERRPLHEFSERAYLDYSMYVILDRALPHIGGRLETGPAAHYLCDVGAWAIG